MVDFYTQRVGPQSSTGTLRGAGSEAFGASVGAAIEQSGERLAEFKRREKAVDDDLDEQYQATEAGKSLAQFGAETDAETLSARETMPAGGAGYSDTLIKSFDKRGEEMLGRISNPKVRDRAAVQLAQMRARVAGEEGAFEAGARVKKNVADVDQQLQISANRLRTSGSVDVFGEVLDHYEATIAGIKLPDAAKQDLRRDGHDRLARSLVEGLPPEQAKAVLEGGKLNDYFKPETLDVLLGQNGVELRRVAAQREAATATGKADAAERITLLQAKIADRYEPSAEEYAEHEGLARTYSLDVKQWDLGVARTAGSFNQETRGWTPAQWAAERSRLAAKGDKRSGPEDIRFKLVEQRAPTAVAQFNNDPHAAAAAAGDPAPAVDWSDPTRGQLEARTVWARSRASAAGLSSTPYLSKEEMVQFRDQARDPAGRLAVAVQLRGAFGVGVGGEIARQIDPDNREMQLFVGLPPASAEWVKNGTAALKRNPGLFAAAPAAAVFNEFAPAIPPEMREAVFTAAKAIVAAGGDQNGVVDWKDNDEGFAQSFRSALHRAAGQVGGGEGRKGGFVNWNSRRAWLPPSMGVTDFQRAVSRAAPTDWLRAGAGNGSAPHYRDGTGKLTRMSEDHVRRFGKYQVGTVTPGVYTLLGGDGLPLALDRNGRPWSFDVRKLGR